jgi:hypothetical protein
MAERLGPSEGIRQFVLSVEDLKFRILRVTDSDQTVFRHTLGSGSEWLAAAQLSASLAANAPMLGSDFDLDRGVRLTVTDVSDDWKRSLTESSDPSDRWAAVLNGSHEFSGLPGSAVEDELHRRIHEAGLPSDQHRLTIHRMATEISAGRPVVVQKKKSG